MFKLLSQWATTSIHCLNAPWIPSLGIDEKDSEANIIIKKVLHIHEKLASKEDLRPCLEVNDLFCELVEICTKTVNESVTRKVLESPLITPIFPSLRSICSAAEYHLESHWAYEIAGSSSQTSENCSVVYDRLTIFPYFGNYISLTLMELSAIKSISQSSVNRIAFIGSGPLPLSSLCLSGVVPLPGLPSRPPVQILNIDSDENAISQSRVLCQNLGLRGEEMKFLHSEAKEIEDLKDFDVVYLAALVGTSQSEKEDLLKRVVGKMIPGQILVVRSAERLRKLMYAEFDPTTEGVLECLDICLVVHPFNHVVNSVIVGKVKDEKLMY